MASTTSKNATTRKVEQGRNNNAAALTRTIIRNKSLSKCETKEDRLSVIKQRMGKQIKKIIKSRYGFNNVEKK